MHVTLQDPSYFLTRPGFHDYYIEYVAGVAYLCSKTYPDIRYTTTDLYVNRCAINEVAVLRSRLKRSEDHMQVLTEENIALRKMFKTGSITAELKSMQEYIGSLMARINTADVMAFPTDVCQSQNEVAA